jgi:hypothetical protein
MLITAQLKKNDKLMSSEIVFKKEYNISLHHQALAGSKLLVVSGPHKDFSNADVYTVLLLNPTHKSADLPFFNADGGWEYVTISID